LDEALDFVQVIHPDRRTALDVLNQPVITGLVRYGLIPW
jgi:hypothetical protein